jgi:hypothetical protein
MNVEYVKFWVEAALTNFNLQHRHLSGETWKASDYLLLIWPSFEPLITGMKISSIKAYTNLFDHI